MDRLSDRIFVEVKEGEVMEMKRILAYMSFALLIGSITITYASEETGSLSIPSSQKLQSPNNLTVFDAKWKKLATVITIDFISFDVMAAVRAPLYWKF
jgi:hypothetical protein